MIVITTMFMNTKYSVSVCCVLYTIIYATSFHNICHEEKSANI